MSPIEVLQRIRRMDYYQIESALDLAANLDPSDVECCEELLAFTEGQATTDDERYYVLVAVAAIRGRDSREAKKAFDACMKSDSFAFKSTLQLLNKIGRRYV